MIPKSRTRIQIHVLMILFLASLTSALLGQELTSGTPVGKPIPILETVVCVGENEGQKQELTAKRLGKPTIYVFIQADHWDRPIARLLRDLDQKTKERLTDGTVLAVWLSNQEVDRFREHLPRVQQSLKLVMTTYTVWPGDPFGPPAWSINRDDHVTLITVKDAKTLGRHSFESIYESDTARILTDFGIKD